MAQKRLSMRKIHEFLRLHHACKLSNRAIARSVNSSHSVVGECLIRAQEIGMGWPLTAATTDARLEQLLYPPPAAPSTRDLALEEHTEAVVAEPVGVVLVVLLPQQQERDTFLEQLPVHLAPVGQGSTRSGESISNSPCARPTPARSVLSTTPAPRYP